jgi:hypothetical protein
MGEARDRKFEDLWLSNIHPCECGEEDEVGPFRIKGYICGVYQDLKGLHDLHSSAEEDNCERRC